MGPSARGCCPPGNGPITCDHRIGPAPVDGPPIGVGSTWMMTSDRFEMWWRRLVRATSAISSLFDAGDDGRVDGNRAVAGHARALSSSRCTPPNDDDSLYDEYRQSEPELADECANKM